MELLYIWVDEINDGLIEQQGFNFDNRFKYQLQNRRDGIFELNIIPNPNFLEGFFSPEYQEAEPTAIINNISAIVGQNGAGKSSIMDFLKENFGRENGEELDAPENYYKEEYTSSGEKYKNFGEKYLYILRKYKDNVLNHYIYISPNMNVKIIKNKELEFFYEVRIDRVGFPRSIDDTTLIYFSNVFDNKEEYATSKLLNISTNYLSSSRFNRDNPWKDRVGRSGNYKLEEINRQISFVRWAQNNNISFKLPFRIPEQVNVVFNDEGNINEFHRVGLDDDFYESIISIHNSTSTDREINTFKLPDSMNDDQFLLVIIFTRCILKHLFDEMRRTPFLRRKVKEVNLKLFEEEGSSNYDSDFIRLISEVERVTEIIEKNSKNTYATTNMLRALAELMRNFYSDYLFNTKVDTTRYGMKFSFDIEELTEERFDDFLNLYNDICFRNELYNFSWRDMSSGEKAFLNIYSRLYLVSNTTDLLKNQENDLIILIDEGEVYLHPHWQGQFIDMLINFVPFVFKKELGLKQRNIQMIVTSNSPFLISDLPSSSVIFLKKEETKTIVIEGLNEYHQTFAANINSLLAHSFFMEDGVTGAFAKRKINEVIHLLAKEDIDTILENEEKIEKTINLIGEPVIRNKLSQMFIDRRMVGVNKEINKLNSRLKRLEKWKDDKNRT
ncbi:AAA ATPase domain-containing protein [Bacillus cereus]|nr:AAA ATPase domain-containing protein [Bacillus cereus]